VIFFQNDKFPAAALAACILGLVICPFLYIAIGALFRFPPAFSLLILPPFLVGSGFLLWRFLSKPTDRAMNILFLLIEGISWIAITVFLILISRFNLQTGFERFGLFCTFFLLTSLCFLPLVLMRKTALEQRLTRLPKSVSISALLVLLALSGLVMIAYLLSTPAFI
jgi:hypothetical protein